MQNSLIREKNIVLLFQLIIISFLCIPGVYLSGNLVFAYDIIIPIFIFYWILKNRKICLLPYEVFVLLYIVAAIFSVIVATISNSEIYLSSILKIYRFSYVIFIGILIYAFFNEINKNKEKLLKTFFIASIIGIVEAILLFVRQSKLYRPTETMYFSGKVLFRAGGIYAEANTFAFVLVIIFSIGLNYLLHKKVSLLTFVVLILSIIGELLSDSRTGALSFVLIFILSIFRKFKISLKLLIIFLVIVVVCVIVYFSVGYVKRFVNQRIFPLITSFFNKGEDAKSVSSGRFDIWASRLKELFSSSPHIILFGNGYKVGNALCDNNYISSIYGCGVVGAICFCLFFISLWARDIFLINNKKILNDNALCYSARDGILLLTIFMFFVDALTMIVPVAMILSLVKFSSLKVRHNKPIFNS